MKKTVSFVLALAIALSMATVGLAGNITSVVDGFSNLESGGHIVLNGSHGGRFCPNDSVAWSIPSTGAFSLGASSNGGYTREESRDLTVVTEIAKGAQAVGKVSIVYTPVSGVSVAWLLVDFAPSVKSITPLDFDFTMYPAINGVRADSDKGLRLTGAFENYVTEVRSDNDSIDMNDGIVAHAVGDVKNIECYLGDDVFLFANMKENEKYWGVATQKGQIYTLDVIGLDKVCTYVNLNADPDAYVYDNNMIWVGRGADKLPFRTTYRVSPTKLHSDSPSRPIGGGGGSGGLSGSRATFGSAPGSSSLFSGGPATAASANGNVSSSGTVSSTAIQAEADTVLKGSGNNAILQTRNAGSISASALQSLADAANGAGKSLTLRADTMSADGKSVEGRLYVEPSKLTGLAGDLKLGVSTGSEKTGATRATFEKWFDNKVSVIRCEQQGSFGAALQVAAKVDLTGLDTETLVFYSYDQATDSYTQIENTAYFIDKNGYVHFSTSLAGDIIITDKLLARK